MNSKEMSTRNGFSGQTKMGKFEFYLGKWKSVMTTEEVEDSKLKSRIENAEAQRFEYPVGRKLSQRDGLAEDRKQMREPKPKHNKFTLPTLFYSLEYI